MPKIKILSYEEFEAFCDRNTCRSCIVRTVMPKCGAGEWIGYESTKEQKLLASDLIRYAEGGEKNGSQNN